MPQGERYDAINGLRVFSAIGIVLMHVLANGKYSVNGFIFDKLIPSFTNLVFLFLVISSFVMCCGYYDKIISNQISVENFYKKRYSRIWPYFALLCLLDFIISPSIDSLYEIFANLTLCFGLLPNANIEVIGVGWFLGLIFVFYLIFPFFCFLLANKRRAWFAFAIAFIFNILCRVYFVETTWANIIYSAVYLIAGGLIFLYKNKLSVLASSYRWFVFILCVCVCVVKVYLCVNGTAVTLVLCTLFLIYSLGAKNEGILSNSITKFLSGISMEIFLCHMIIYRVLEKLSLTHLFKSSVISYIITAVVTVIGAIAFAQITRLILLKGQIFMKGFMAKKVKGYKL